MDDNMESFESLEVQSSAEEVGMASDENLDSAGESMGQEGSVLAILPEDPVETFAGSSAGSSEVSYTLAPEAVEQIVDAVSARVNDLVQTATETFTVMKEQGEEELAEPMVVINADELLDRLDARLAETARAAVPMVELQEVPVPVEGGELTVIEVVQSLLSYFQESDNQLLTAIRDNTGSIKDRVTEIKQYVSPHSLMETLFEQYTVTEGLLLVLVLWLVVLKPCVKMIKGGFSWLV